MKTVLTGVKPTGIPHIGNYLGAMRPSIQLAGGENTKSLLFIADYHGLISIHNAEELKNLTHIVTASWLAAGVDSSKTIIYRQSDVPETFELHWILSCMTAKGLMNRAHAYKAKTAENHEFGREDLDYGVNMGLYTYPVLMAADILLYDVDLVPVGRDQVQHVEIARDIAEKFNRSFGGECLKLPQAKIENPEVPGLDGRKMSKSYDNYIPLFEESKKLRKLVMKIKTDSSAPEDPKDPKTSSIMDLYKSFATPQEVEELAKRYQSGIGWGEAKEALYLAIEREVGPKREVFQDYISHPEKVDAILKEGALKARKLAREKINQIRMQIGID